MSEDKSVEPWLRGGRLDVPAVAAAVLHALQLADEDLRKWCDGLSSDELNSRPSGLAPVAFHLRHIARSLDRLLTYAEGGTLSPGQIAELKTELEPGASKENLFHELSAGLSHSGVRVRKLASANLEEPRTVGNRKLPTTLGGLLVHVADHTQRHVGQAIVTAKVVTDQKNSRSEG